METGSGRGSALRRGGGAVRAGQDWTGAKVFACAVYRLVKQRTAAGQSVFTVYECCGFGYTLHEELAAAGAHSIREPLNDQF